MVLEVIHGRVPGNSTGSFSEQALRMLPFHSLDENLGRSVGRA
jgi:hypothetical protein